MGLCSVLLSSAALLLAGLNDVGVRAGVNSHCNIVATHPCAFMLEAFAAGACVCSVCVQMR
jgi:hypothetical protein